MKTYAGGETIEWKPTGGKNEAVHIATFQLPSNLGTITCTLRAEASAETSKSGMRRVLLKMSTTVPNSSFYLTGDHNMGAGGSVGKGVNLPISVHTVITAPSEAIRMSRDSAEVADTFGTIVDTLICHLMALMGGSMFGNQPSGRISTDPQFAVASGLLGSEPLDPVSGEYGNEH